MLVNWEEAATIGDVDLCIIGAGAAGITLARAFAGRNEKVLLLESGGFNYVRATQDLYDTTSVGLPNSVATSRLRFFGGTTNHWSGQSRPLEPIDFEPREGIPHSGWPIAYSDYERFLDAAHLISGLGPVEYAPEAWEGTLGDDPCSESTRIESKIFQLSLPNMRWGEEYRAELVDASNVFVLLNANAIELHPDPQARTIREIEVGNLAGGRQRLVARRFVLACGGIENPRLMLASNSVTPNGIGNESDNVGRFFREHPNLAIQELVAGETLQRLPLSWESSNNTRNGRRTTLLRTLGLTRRAMEEGQLLGQILFLWGEQRNPTDSPAASVLEEDIRSGPWAGAFDPKMLLRASTVVEQASNPDSRVRLSANIDPFGKPHAELDWQLTELDRRSLRTGAEILAAELARLGIARSHLLPSTADPTHPISPGIGHHHMGTTRMSASPDEGVVNENCRAHSIDNLWLAGSSIFPTGGIANPTMNIVALTLRLAEHLAGENA